jgi:general secretion pathway protein N
MAGIEMKLRAAYPLLAGAALLGAAVGYVEMTRTVAQPADGSANPGAAVSARAATPPAPAAAASLPPSGNPLWTIPLKELTMTQERPIFSPSRRPPPPPPAAPVYVAPAPRPPPKPKEPERPTITLVGTVASKSEGIGVFMETASRNIVRLRVGDDHQGWVLRSIKAREATLAKDSETAVLELPPPGGEAAMLANSTPPDDPPPRPRPPRR